MDADSWIVVRAVCLAVLLVPVLGAASAGAAQKQSQVTLGNARFTVITPECIRLEYSPDGRFVDDPSYFAANRNTRYPAKIRTEQDGLEIDTGVIKLRYRNNGRPFDADNLKASIAGNIRWYPGKQNQGNLGGAIRTLDGVDGCVKLDDGVLSRDGWYVLDDSKGPLLTQDWIQSRQANSNLDWYLFGYGDDYKAAIRSLTAVGGSIPLPRKYTLGAWYSRYWPYTSEDYRGIVREYSQHRFPLDIIVMDMDWHKDGWTGWSINRKLLPDFEQLLAWFHENRLAVTMNVHPADGILEHEDMYADFMRAMGKDPQKEKPLPYDAGDKKYLDALFKFTHEPLEALGVDFWWLDWQQYPYTRSIPDVTNLQWLNEYYFRHTSSQGKRGASFSRWAGWGDHRHPIHFSGDSTTNWRTLAFEVPFTSASSNSGCFFWSHDIGGHMGGRNEESYTRWCQFGAFSAALRSHSTRDASMDRRPWTYPRWAEDSMRISFHLRSEFFPYTYSSAREAVKDSIPLIRPMYIEYPKDQSAYIQPQQYMYGDNVIVSPIAEPGVGDSRIGRQAVWLPDGYWYNYFTGENYQRRGEYLVAATIDEFPLFVRGGVPLPMQNYTERMATEPLKELVIRCYPGPDRKTGKFSLYEDDGISDRYKTGEFAVTELEYHRDGKNVTISVEPTRGGFDGQVKRRSYRIELACTKPALTAQLDGRSIECRYDYQRAMNIISVPERPIDNGFKLTVTAETVNAEQAFVKAFVRRTGQPTSMSNQSPKKVLAEALDNPGSLNQKTVFACAGIGTLDKIETPYGYPDTKTVRQYSSGLVKANLTSEIVNTPDDAQALQTTISFGGRKYTITEPRNTPIDLGKYRDKNAALQASASFSSLEFPETSGINDGKIGGYPMNRSQEWSTRAEKEGAWVRLDWQQPQTIERIIVFDRINTADRVLAGEIEFSDGSKVDVGELDDTAVKGTSITFEPKTITWLRFNVRKVSRETQNTGLSELVVLRK